MKTQFCCSQFSQKLSCARVRDIGKKWKELNQRPTTSELQIWTGNNKMCQMSFAAVSFHFISFERMSSVELIYFWFLLLSSFHTCTLSLSLSLFLPLTVAHANRECTHTYVRQVVQQIVCLSNHHNNAKFVWSLWAFFLVATEVFVVVVVVIIVALFRWWWWFVVCLCPLFSEKLLFLLFFFFVEKKMPPENFSLIRLYGSSKIKYNFFFSFFWPFNLAFLDSKYVSQMCECMCFLCWHVEKSFFSCFSLAMPGFGHFLKWAEHSNKNSAQKYLIAACVTAAAVLLLCW